MFFPPLILHSSFMRMKTEENKKIEENNEDDDLTDFGTSNNVHV